MEEINIKKPLYLEGLCVELYSDGDGVDEDYRLDFSLSSLHSFEVLNKKEVEQLYEYLKQSLGK